MPKTPTKADDLFALGGLAVAIQEMSCDLKAAIERRRQIIVRRSAAGDTTQDELAAAAGTTKANVQAALRVHRSRS